MRDEIEEYRESSWKRINKKAQAAGLIAPGSKRFEKDIIPTISVYFDRSASWNTEKSEFGYRALNAVSAMAKKGEIAIEMHYFNTKILE